MSKRSYSIENIWGKRSLLTILFSEGEKRTTIYDIINRFESGKKTKHRFGGGRPANRPKKT